MPPKSAYKDRECPNKAANRGLHVWDGNVCMACGRTRKQLEVKRQEWCPNGWKNKHNFVAGECDDCGKLED